MIRKTKMSSASRNGGSASDIERVDVYYSDDEDEVGFSEGEPKLKNAVATFNFVMGNEKPSDISALVANELNKSIPEAVELKKPSFEFITESKTAKVRPKGLTPPIDGENFSMKRGYQFRPSTLRKLNEIKTKHPDLDVYLNTILDAAILHYYNYIMQEGGQF